jgi:hypothetical protein
MKSLLDQYIPTAVRPGTARQLFALRLAQKLGDAVAARHYVGLSDSYSEGQLLSAYRRAVRENGHGELGKRFHAELAQIRGNGHHDHPASLLAIRIERRTVAVAIFNGDHLEFADSRQLSSDNDKAVASAVGFIGWILARFTVESTALEAIVNGHEIQRRALRDAICATLRERMLSVWEIPKTVLFEAYGVPALKSRAELRRIATAVWPILAGTHAKPFMQDAAVLGLHVQIERLFIIN